MQCLSKGKGVFIFVSLFISQHNYCSQISNELSEDEIAVTWTVNSDRGVSHEEADAESLVLVISLWS